LPNRDQLEVVLLANGTYDDLSPLASLPNLRRLEISNRNLESVDLSLFPNLEVFHAARMEKLIQISNVGSHPALIDLELTGSKELSSLGPAAPNRQLRCLMLSACPMLTDLETLSQTTALKQVFICNWWIFQGKVLFGWCSSISNVIPAWVCSRSSKRSPSAVAGVQKPP
jgi:hypothetical protein